MLDMITKLLILSILSTILLWEVSAKFDINVLKQCLPKLNETLCSDTATNVIETKFEDYDDQESQEGKCEWAKAYVDCVVGQARAKCEQGEVDNVRHMFEFSNVKQVCNVTIVHSNEI